MSKTALVFSMQSHKYLSKSAFVAAPRCHYIFLQATNLVFSIQFQAKTKYLSHLATSPNAPLDFGYEAVSFSRKQVKK